MMESIGWYLFFGVLWSLYWESFGPEEYPMNNGKRFRYIFFWPIGVFAWIVGFTIGLILHLIRIFKGKE